MKLDKIKIRNFKNYLHEVEFDLSKELVIIYGLNGFGKSSFFDAIEWCLTGKIDRFDGDDAELKKDIVNKRSLEKNTEVSVTLYFEGNTLVRSFNIKENNFSSTNVKLQCENGKLIRGKSKVENYLKSKINSTDQESKERFNDFLKQSNILSQQQINDFITSDSAKERFIALGNILGLKSELIEFKNFKKVFESFRNEIENTSNEISKIRESIEERNNDITLLDFDTLNPILESYQDYFQGEISTELLNAETSKRLMEIEKHKKQIVSIHELKEEFGNRNVSSINEVVNNYDKANNKKIKKMNMLKELQSRASNKILLLNKSISDLKNINDIKQKLNENMDGIKKLSKKEFTVEQLNIEMSNLRKRRTEIEYNIDYKKYVSLNQNKYINDLSTLSKSNLKIFELEKKIFKTEKIEKDIHNIIQSSKDFIIGDLISGIREIKKFTMNNNDDICPVCLSQVPNFNEVLESSLKTYLLELDSQSLQYEKKLSSQKYLNDRIRKLKNNKKNVNKKIVNLKRDISDYENEIIGYQASSLYTEELSSVPLEDLQIRLLETENKLLKYKQILDLTLIRIQLIENLEMYNQSSTVSVRFKDELSVTNEIKICKSRLKKFEEAYIHNKNHFDENKIKIFRTKSKLDLISRGLSNEQQVKDLESLSEEMISIVHVLEKEIEDFKSIEKLFLGQELYKSILNQISSLVKKEKELEVKKKKYNNKLAEMGVYKDKAQQRLGKGISGLLNQKEASVQKIYRYLDPLPSNSSLIFEGDGEKLQIKIAYDKELEESSLNLSNAKNVLSSGQLNVLAISIFLAINKDQKIHSLDFIGIDDPIQNMDDINQYTICDVLSSLNKQLIISTHDFNFLKLIYKKNEYRKEEIVIYDLTSPYVSKEKVRKLMFVDNNPLIT